MKKPCIYIVTNRTNGALYTGVTSDLLKRVFQHKEGILEGFTKKYSCHKIVSINPTWRDLYEDIT